MEDHASLQSEATTATSFVQRTGLSRLLSRVKTSWRRSFSNGSLPSASQSSMSMSPQRGHSAASSNPVEETTFQEIFQKRAEQSSTPPWAADNRDEMMEIEAEEPKDLEQAEGPEAFEQAERREESKEPELPVEPPELEEPDMPQPPSKAILRSRAQAERLRKMTQQYNLPIPDELLAYTTPHKELNRIHRPIRMRVHRSCHRCNTMFGDARVCAGCSHRVCTLCESTPRQNFAPSVRDPATANPHSTDLEVDDFQGLQQQIKLTRAQRTSTQPLVRKELRQRVRRTCHGCSRMFASGSRTCANCHHVCCVECPRYPPKRRKFPSGYPGDEPSSSSSSSSPPPIIYACHRCGDSYPPVPHPDSRESQEQPEAPMLLDCARCGHSRCHLCRRARPGQAALAPTSDPDLDLLRSVEAKLAAISS